MCFVLTVTMALAGRSGSGDEAIVYDYFEHVDIDQEIDDLQNDMTRCPLICVLDLKTNSRFLLNYIAASRSAMESNENKWSSDALGSDTSSAFRKQQGIKKPSPLTRHSGQGLKIGMMSNVFYRLRVSTP